MSCQVKIIADSINQYGNRITTFQLSYWRAIHGEVMTHRVLSRNAMSSRAVPVKKIIGQVWNNPAMPIHYGANRAGMQAKEELKGWRLAAVKAVNVLERNVACGAAWVKVWLGLHKQVANRYLEPWQYMHTVVTATDWDNFFALRCHPDAQPEFQELALAMRSALAESKPVLRYHDAEAPDKDAIEASWHLPYVTDEERKLHPVSVLCKLSTARCARVSFLTHDGQTPILEKDMDLHEKLVGAVPIHASPTEHCARAAWNSRYKNFKGWQQYRAFVEAKHG